MLKQCACSITVVKGAPCDINVDVLIVCTCAQAACWGYSSLLDVPSSPLDVEVRPLCDRWVHIM